MAPSIDLGFIESLQVGYNPFSFSIASRSRSDELTHSNCFENRASSMTLIEECSKHLNTGFLLVMSWHIIPRARLSHSPSPNW